MQTTVGIIKPEAIKKGLVEIITKRIEDSDLVIKSSLKKIITSYEFGIIYGHVKEPEWLHNARKKYLTANESIFLKISGENAVVKLLNIRGSSNPRYAFPGTIRGDFAKDQNYIELRKQRKIALNFFHACDTEKEAYALIHCLKL